MHQSQDQHQHSDIYKVKEYDDFLTKKADHSLMVGEDLDKQIQDYLGYFRSAGAVINTAVIIASAKGILMYKISICYRESI